jgi:hypothetical protein
MASSSADCVLGGVRLISSASRMFEKIGPGHEGPGAASGGGIFLNDVGAGDVGRHQIGRELDALEHQAERLRQRAHQQRLGRSRQTGDQTVAAHKQRDHHLFDDLVLSDNHLADFADDAAVDFLETLDSLFYFRRIVDRYGGGGHV